MDFSYEEIQEITNLLNRTGLCEKIRKIGHVSKAYLFEAFLDQMELIIDADKDSLLPKEIIDFYLKLQEETEEEEKKPEARKSPPAFIEMSEEHFPLPDRIKTVKINYQSMSIFTNIMDLIIDDFLISDFEIMQKLKERGFDTTTRYLRVRAKHSRDFLELLDKKDKLKGMKL